MKKALSRCLSIALALVMMASLVTLSSAAVTQNRHTFQNYADFSYPSDLQYRANCYGYALQTYYDGTGTYKQQPGEFAVNTEVWSSLYTSYKNWFPNLSTPNFVRDRVIEDLPAFGCSAVVSPTIPTCSSGERVIALVLKEKDVTGDGVVDVRDWNSSGVDFHFYVRQDSTHWYHKRGSDPPSSRSIDTNVAITDANIFTTAIQGGYNDLPATGGYNRIQFFKITKDAVYDYPHGDGQINSVQYTPKNFKDKAGNEINAYSTASLGDNSCKFDSTHDYDYFRFVAPQTKSYVISTAGTGLDIDGTVYSSSGAIIQSNTSAGNASFTISMTAGQAYYIELHDFQHQVKAYTLTILAN